MEQYKAYSQLELKSELADLMEEQEFLKDEISDIDIKKEYDDNQEKIDFINSMITDSVSSEPVEEIEEIEQIEQIEKIEEPLEDDVPFPPIPDYLFYADGGMTKKYFVPRYVKDKISPNFLNVYIDYPTPSGVQVAYGKETMSGQQRRLGSEKAMNIAKDIVKDIKEKHRHNLEDIDYFDNERGKVTIFAVSDDFEDTNFALGGYLASAGIGAYYGAKNPKSVKKVTDPIDKAISQIGKNLTDKKYAKGGKLKGKKIINFYYDVYNNPNRYEDRDNSKLDGEYKKAFELAMANVKKDKKEGTYEFNKPYAKGGMTGFNKFFDKFKRSDAYISEPMKTAKGNYRVEVDPYDKETSKKMKDYMQSEGIGYSPKPMGKGFYTQFAKGGEVEFRKLANSKNFDLVTPDGRYEIEMGAFGIPKSIIVGDTRKDINTNPIAIKYRGEIQEYIDANSFSKYAKGGETEKYQTRYLLSNYGYMGDKGTEIEVVDIKGDVVLGNPKGIMMNDFQKTRLPYEYEIKDTSVLPVLAKGGMITEESNYDIIANVKKEQGESDFYYALYDKLVAYGERPKIAFSEMKEVFDNYDEDMSDYIDLPFAKGGEIEERVYAIDMRADMYQDEGFFTYNQFKRYADELSDDEFMDEAETQGLVWSSMDKFLDSNEYNEKGDNLNFREIPVKMMVAKEYVNPDFLEKGGEIKVGDYVSVDAGYGMKHIGKVNSKHHMHNDRVYVDGIGDALEIKRLTKVKPPSMADGGEVITDSFGDKYELREDEEININDYVYFGDTGDISVVEDEEDLEFARAGKTKAVPYAKGGETASPITNYHKNFMGTLSFDLKVKGMRKPQDFIVYPITGKTNIIRIQSDKKWGEIDATTGKGILSKTGNNSWAFALDVSNRNVNKFELSDEELEELKNKIRETSGKEVGNAIITTDNSGAELLADGGVLNMDEVSIYEGADDNYTIVMSGDVYDMNSFSMPNTSINTYIGDRRDYPSDISHWGKKIKYDNAPMVIKEKIDMRKEEFEHGGKIHNDKEDDIQMLKDMISEEKDDDIKKELKKELEKLKTK